VRALTARLAWLTCMRSTLPRSTATVGGCCSRRRRREMQPGGIRACADAGAALPQRRRWSTLPVPCVDQCLSESDRQAQDSDPRGRVPAGAAFVGGIGRRWHADREFVAAVLERCGEAGATVAVLHYVHGMSQVEIAESLGITRRTVFSRLRKLARIGRNCWGWRSPRVNDEERGRLKMDCTLHLPFVHRTRFETLRTARTSTHTELTSRRARIAHFCDFCGSAALHKEPIFDRMAYERCFVPWCAPPSRRSLPPMNRTAAMGRSCVRRAAVTGGLAGHLGEIRTLVQRLVRRFFGRPRSP